MEDTSGHESLADRLRPSSAEWGTTPPATAAELAGAFERDTALTVGAEEELMLVDPETFALVPAIETVLGRAGDDGRFTREIRASQVEIVTPVAGNAQALGIALAAARLDLARHAGPEASLLGSGTHPWDENWGALAEGERYSRLAEEFPWATAGSIPCGLHIHVGIRGAERALAVYNALRGYLPELSALAANSPFLAGLDTGLASARRTLNDAFHRTGIPPAFDDWDAFTSFVRWGQRGGVFPDAQHLWWDLRPHPSFGTLELRVADAQTRVQDVVSLVAVYQSLVAYLCDRLDAEGSLEVLPEERIAENAYRAVRYGVRGWMVDPITGERETTRSRITRLLDRLEAGAERLGNASALLEARSLVADNGADRQRYLAARSPEGDGLRNLASWLSQETLTSAEVLLDRHL